MSEPSYHGNSALTLDAKGRIAIPARHRDVLQVSADNQLTLTKSIEGCLYMFPKPSWPAFRDKIAGLPMSEQRWKRFYLGPAMDVEIDSSSRVLISPELRDYAGLVRDVVLVGMGSHFEIWDAARHRADEEATKTVAPPAAIKDLVF